ncbi:hypothetical protein [Marinoscillum furvescens]|uniref:Uncharacterized protein n=1 Tax=Marinoscillum furvescens DSM 4134 TaxID=1122208 RepID=A0A3D9KXB6_MARFU|nr:hypothetical protein [Marinoscillum furvescens]RED93381.1 hypothetical protein C7460_12526 [Marinoscillum furvescens DSM 4134]
MAKKQVRLATNQLEQFIGSGKKLNFIQSNGAVFLAEVLEVQSSEVKVKNTKGHILHLPLAQLEEIWAEEKAS